MGTREVPMWDVAAGKPTTGVARTGVWLVAGAALGQPYPCRCHERSGRDCGGTWCPCFGRTDLAGLTPACCGVRVYLATMQR